MPSALEATNIKAISSPVLDVDLMWTEVVTASLFNTKEKHCELTFLIDVTDCESNNLGADFIQK